MAPRLVLHRLTPNDPHAWGLWPILEARVRKHTPDLAPGTDPERIIAMLREMWGARPAMLGVWVARELSPELNGHDPQPIVGHMVGWVDTHWGEPVIFLCQLVTDPGKGTPLRLPMMLELERWREELNVIYSAAGPHRIRRCKLFAYRPEAYQRWLSDFVEMDSGGTLMMFDLSAMTIPAEEAS